MEVINFFNNLLNIHFYLGLIFGGKELIKKIQNAVEIVQNDLHQIFECRNNEMKLLNDEFQLNNYTGIHFI
jgi:hypothetical protein